MKRNIEINAYGIDCKGFGTVWSSWSSLLGEVV
jgi:hypothetical protein